MQIIKAGAVLDVEQVPPAGLNPFTVSHVGHQAEGKYYEGTWANGKPGIVFAEDLA